MQLSDVGLHLLYVYNVYCTNGVYGAQMLETT